jgi:phospholipid-binding lipoprotein MlaA
MSRRRLRSVSGKPFCRAALAAMTLLLGGCALTPRGVDPPGEVTERPFSPLEVYDPLEGWNRRVYKFNAQADRYVLLPVVDAYKFTVPQIFRHRISDFFTNLKTPIIFANELLQLKFADALATALRFGANTTFGMFGFVDVASPMGLPKYHEDFGQTLGFWGVGAGGYLMLPILGPSGYRDAAGTGADVAASSMVDPLGALSLDSARPAFLTVNVIDARYQQPFRYFQTGSPFEYLLVRFAYTKKREIEIGPGIQWGRATDRQEPDGDGEQRELAAGYHQP